MSCFKDEKYSSLYTHWRPRRILTRVSSTFDPAVLDQFRLVGTLPAEEFAPTPKDFPDMTDLGRHKKCTLEVLKFLAADLNVLDLVVFGKDKPIWAAVCFPTGSHSYALPVLEIKGRNDINMYLLHMKK